MKKLSELFYECAFDNVPWQEVGLGVNYAFVEEGTTLYIYFQGSSQKVDWIRNFLFRKVPFKDIDVKFRVHKGFLSAWKEVEDIIINKVCEKKEILVSETEARFEYKWRQIIIVGYSHGGALSGICHEVVWYHRPDLRKNKLFGFGFESPRFYAGFRVKKALRERWANYTVIRDHNDIVTHCPPVIFGYTHVGKILKIKGDLNLAGVKTLNCVKAHYPQVVYDGLVKYEEDIK